MKDGLEGRTTVFIVGGPGGGSISPPVHDYIAQCLGRDWKMSFLEASTIEEVVDAFRASNFAGGIVTMPWKKTIIPHLDHIDDLVLRLGACNHVSVAADGTLHGTNTDWIGVKDALLQAHSPVSNTTGNKGMVLGAGGACRAAIYALTELGCNEIFVVNRDVGEVQDLINDVQNYDISNRPAIIHVQTIDQARQLPAPHYVVGTIPDFEPNTASEIEARDVYTEFLSKRKANGDHPAVMLDMCYHPLPTRNMRLAQEHAWKVVDGIQVIGYQFRAQWKPWTGREIDKLQEAKACEMLRECALRDPTVTPVAAAKL